MQSIGIWRWLILATFAVAVWPYSIRAERPNVILIMVDDMGWGDVSYRMAAPGDIYAGHPEIATPNLEQMAAAGLKFHRGYAASPICSPTRMSVLTGRHARRSGLMTPFHLSEDDKLRNSDVTIAELAQTQGYRTGHFGKWHVGSLSKHAPDMRVSREGNSYHYSAPWNNGYDVTFASESWAATYDPYDHFSSNNPELPDFAYFTGPSDAAQSNRVPKDVRVDNLPETTIVGQQAMRFIEDSARSGQHFFTTVWFSTPHLPLIDDPSDPRQTGGVNSRGAYHEGIAKIDDQIGLIRDQLRMLGIADDTLLVFSSDNGPETGSTGGLRGGKRQLTEGGLRVPLLMEWQDHIPPKSTNAIATSSDLLPTLMDLWDVDIPDDRPLDGSSLLDVMSGLATQRDRDYRFVSASEGRLMIMDNRYKLLSPDQGVSFELFDLRADPSESSPVGTTANLASRSLSIQKKFSDLEADLAEWMRETTSSARGTDYDDRIESTQRGTVRQDAEMSSPLVKTGQRKRYRRQDGTSFLTDEVYRDGYRLVEGSFEDSENASVFVERQYATLADHLVVDGDGSAGPFSTSHRPADHVIEAGTVVNSYLVHFDPDVEQGAAELDLTITFDDAILGVIAASEHLEASDLLSFGEPVFDQGNLSRGSLLGEPADGGWTISADGRTISINMVASFDGYDQLRIVTHSSLQLAPTPLGWHNPTLATDVNNDRTTTPLDALLIVNELTDRDFSDPTGRLDTPGHQLAFYDVNDDGVITPLDALLVLNATRHGGFAASSTSVVPEPCGVTLLMLLGAGMLVVYRTQ